MKMKDVESPSTGKGDEVSALLDKEGNPIPALEMEPPPQEAAPPADAGSSSTVSALGLKILILLAFQNCFKNLLMRYVMKDQPKFLLSAAIIGVEVVKLVLCVFWIVVVDKRPLSSIYEFLRDDHRNSLLLGIPATAYSFQMSMEYVALANLDAAVFSVLVQCKLLTTATFSAVILRKRLKYIQIISLVLLTAGVMLINVNKMQEDKNGETEDGLVANNTGVIATLAIAVSSGFAGVYTEKVIKAQRKKSVAAQNYSLAYMQVQLALVSLVILGIYAVAKDHKAILENGLWHNFTTGAFVSVFNSAIGGLVVAAVLKYADAVLKGYATAISVVMTGILSMFLFGTKLNALYFMGIVNVVCAVILYNGKNMDKFACN